MLTTVVMHASSLQTLTALITLLLPAFGFAQNNTIVTNASTVSVPYELTYLLPGSNFTSDYYYTFTNGTTTTNATVNALLQSASSAAFISYDDEFLSILGADPIVTLVTQEAGGFAFEAGVWVPDTNEVSFELYSAAAAIRHCPSELIPETSRSGSLLLHSCYPTKSTFFR